MTSGESHLPSAKRTVLRRTRNGVKYVGHAEGDGARLFETVCKLGLEGIVSKETRLALQIGTIEKLDQGSAPAATRGADGRF